jgi:antitoxin CptB
VAIMTQSTHIRQIRWRCHRGMLELDCILLNFFDASYADLPDSDRALFVELLQEQDPQLWDWFLHPETTDPKFAALVRKILEQTEAGTPACPTH